MGIVIKKAMNTSIGGYSQKTIGQVLTGPKDKLVIFLYDERGNKVEEKIQTFHDGTNVDMILKWSTDKWRWFLKDTFFKYYGPGRYYVVDMRGGQGLVKLFGPTQVT